MRTLNNENGQSAIEFILTFSFALGLTFLFVNQAINLTGGYFAHYVNFMAARTYFVHEVGIDVKETNISRAKQLAGEVFDSYPLKNFGVNADFKVISANENNAVFTGTVLSFEKALSSLPVVGGREKALFYSEAFLGKEPVRATCMQMVCAAITGNQNECKTKYENMDIVLYDNGC